MKKIILAAVAASTMFAAPAFAQSNPTSAPNGSIEIPLSGTLAKRCIVSAFLNGPFDALNLESTAVQGAESLSSSCNYAGQSTVTFSSANNGALKSGDIAIPYKFYLSGSPLSGGVSLSSPQVWSAFPSGGTAPNTTGTRSMSVQLDSIATVAGTYTDTITVAVQPN